MKKRYLSLGLFVTKLHNAMQTDLILKLGIPRSNSQRTTTDFSTTFLLKNFAHLASGFVNVLELKNHGDKKARDQAEERGHHAQLTDSPEANSKPDPVPVTGRPGT